MQEPGRDILDVLVVGAGISGISAAWHLQTLCPRRRFAVLEARERLGGTWDLFRYPGVRSDSDMFTLGFAFRPWHGERAIAEGPAILQYLHDTVREFDLARHIRFNHRVRHASWSSVDGCWRVTVDGPRTAALPRSTPADDSQLLRCRFLFLCSGYYRYDRGHQPDFPGLEQFAGRVVHPQFWPDDLELRGRRVLVVGSGATAVTLVPALARAGAEVTMLQRSPTYMISLPSRDAIAAALHRVLPARAASALTRWKNVLLALLVFRLCRARPERAKAFLVDAVRRRLPPGVDADAHFAPRYNPWEQRLCLVPDGDLFRALRAGDVQVVTDTIERFTPSGVRLAGGRELAADVVVSATGLELQLLGGAGLDVDGQAVDPSRLVVYKGVMYGDLPNCAATFGYTNASWTLKADLTSRWVCRLLNHMERTGARVATPRLLDAAMPLDPFVDFSSGYFQRHLASLPRQGRLPPWRLNQNVLSDLLALRFGRVDDGVLEFAA